MAKYILSEEAEKDIDELFEFGKNKFGRSQAISYLIELKQYIELIAQNPNVGRQRSDIREELYSLPFSSHIIFYRIFERHIRIIRILYGGRDLIKFLK